MLSKVLAKQDNKDESRIIKNNNSMIPWDKLTEPAKQHFTKTWGKVILTNIYTMTQWKLSPNNNRKPHELYPRPEICDEKDEHLDEFIVSPEHELASSRVNITISCDQKDVINITS